MKRFLLAIIGSAVLAGCQTFAPSAPTPKAAAVPTPTTLSASQITAMETGVQVVLKNPKFTLFKTSSFQAATSSTGVTTACGYIRRKKASSVDEPFIGAFTGSLFVVSSVGDTAPATETTMAACQNAGISLQLPVVSSKPAVKAKTVAAPPAEPGPREYPAALRRSPSRAERRNNPVRVNRRASER
jgi:hypothetical protein